jgi:hypothetical protein
MKNQFRERKSSINEIFKSSMEIITNNLDQKKYQGLKTRFRNYYIHIVIKKIRNYDLNIQDL